MKPLPMQASTFPTPFGPFAIAIDDSGAVAAAVFGGAEDLASLLGPGKEKQGAHPTSARPDRNPSPDPLSRAREQILAYCAGRLRAFALPLAPAGTPFQRRVWAELEKIPFGQTRTYGEIARALGSGPRAVGGAVGANPLCLLIPCHRVVGAAGSLGGYAYGLETKRRLLRHEGAEQGQPAGVA